MAEERRPTCEEDPAVVLSVETKAEHLEALPAGGGDGDDRLAGGDHEHVPGGHLRPHFLIPHAALFRCFPAAAPPYHLDVALAGDHEGDPGRPRVVRRSFHGSL